MKDRENKSEKQIGRKGPTVEPESKGRQDKEWYSRGDVRESGVTEPPALPRKLLNIICEHPQCIKPYYGRDKGVGGIPGPILLVAFFISLMSQSNHTPLTLQSNPVILFHLRTSTLSVPGCRSSLS